MRARPTLAPTAKVRLTSALLVATAFACSSPAGEGPTNVYQPPEPDETEEPFLFGQATPATQPDIAIGSGSIKSYLEDVELEPPLSTGSIFATGYFNPGLAGVTAGSEQWVELLGLGAGPLSVLVVFDRSVSMSDPWEGEPKWKVASRAFMNGLTGVGDRVTIAALFFPQPAQCEMAPLSDPRQIQFQAGTGFRQHWEAFPQNRFPSGGTPLGAAFEEVDIAIGQAAAHGLLDAGRRFRVVVVTDGQPNCGTELERVLFLAGEWRARGIEIHVIGLPGSEEATDFLNQLANIGGTFQHQAPASESEAEEDFAFAVA
jgi:hypothetical protein